MQPYEECPRFDKCIVPLCPLDPEISMRVALKNEEKCTMEKRVRYRIGSKYSNLLKYQGLTKQEWRGKQMREAYRVKQGELGLKQGENNEKSLIHPIVVIFLMVFLLPLITIPCFAEQSISIKGGYIDIMTDGLSKSPVMAVSYEYKHKWLGKLDWALEGEVETFIPKLTKVGNVIFVPVSIIPKLYFGDVYVGAKFGYIFNYAGKDIDVRFEPTTGELVGVMLPNDYFTELQFNTADLSVQHSLPYEIGTDSWSRLNNWQILVGKKIKF